MRHLTAVVILAVVLSSCAQGARTTPDEQPDSGVRGTVLLGPQCPVESAESPCPAVPWVGTVRATRGGDRVERRTAQDGTYELRLAPGMWTLQPLVEGGGPPSAGSITVRVQPHSFAEVTLTVDTGIR